MSRATSIQEVLDQLDLIIENSLATNDRLGLFAFVYRRTTAEILKEIQLKSFEDNERMERLDVAFANLYLDAYKNHQSGGEIPKSWEFAFANKDKPVTILQHITIGMNAHINLDLAIATSTAMRGKEPKDIQNDYNKVNDILYNIINEMQDRLSRVSRLMFLLDLIGKKTDEQIIDFSLRKAREQAWNNSNLLWALGDPQKDDAIKGIDLLVLSLSERILSPKSWLLRFILKIILKFENKDVPTIISKLRED